MDGCWSALGIELYGELLVFKGGCLINRYKHKRKCN